MGISIYDGTISDCTVSYNGDNGITGFGAEGPLTIRGCTITGNANHGIWCNYGPAHQTTIMNCTVSDNGAVGIYYFGDGVATITGCSITGNGTGISYYGNENGSATMENCIVMNNISPGYNAGGIDIVGCISLSLINCSIIGNTSGYSGGISVGNVTSAMIMNCTIIGNTGDY